MDDWSARVHEAHADASAVLGGVFADGARASARGARMMATGLAQEWCNTADVFSPDADAVAIAEFYGSRRLRYGVRVPAGMAWSHGVRVVQLRLMFVARGAWAPVEPPPFVEIEAAGPRDLDEVVAVDCAAFGSQPAAVGPWIEGLVRAPDDAVTYACARRGETIVGVGYAIHANGVSGRSAGIGGIGVAPGARRGGIGAVLTTWLVRRSFAAGAEVVQLAADDERAVRLYSRLGFVETGSLDVYAGEARAAGSPGTGADPAESGRDDRDRERGDHRRSG